MTAEAKKTTTTPQPPETGWATAHRVRGQGIRTCVRATLDGDAGRERWGERGTTIVRGED